MLLRFDLDTIYGLDVSGTALSTEFVPGMKWNFGSLHDLPHSSAPNLEPRCQHLHGLKPYPNGKFR